MLNRTMKIVAPVELLLKATMLGIKNIKTPREAVFGTKVGDDWFLIRGTKSGVSVTYKKSRPD